MVVATPVQSSPECTLLHSPSLTQVQPADMINAGQLENRVLNFSQSPPIDPEMAVKQNGVHHSNSTNIGTTNKMQVSSEMTVPEELPPPESLICEVDESDDFFSGKATWFLLH